MEKLKPCPFCGAVPTIRKTHTSESDLVIYVLEAEHLRWCYLTSMDGMNDTGRSTAFNSYSLVKSWNRRYIVSERR